MGKGDLYTGDLLKYSDCLDEVLLSFSAKNAEYLIEKHHFYDVVIKHKKINGNKLFTHEVKINTRGLDTSKLSNSLQSKQITEWAGVAMGLLVTQWLTPTTIFRVLVQGEGYDYEYQQMGKQDWEKIEMTATEIPAGGSKRLKEKIRKFDSKFPDSSGYISVSSFAEKLQYYWGHKN